MAIQILRAKEESVDERGRITHLVDEDVFTFRGVLRITSKAGSIRSNHYHKHDFHYLYVESGKCEYSERPSNNPTAKVETIILQPGDMVLSKPEIIHAVKFLEDTVLYAFTTEKRQQDLYEKDTERVTIVD